MRTVYHAQNPIDAHLVKHALEDAGIPAHVFGEHLMGGMGELMAGGFIIVQVLDADFDAARGLVDALPLVSGEAVPGDADEGTEDDAGEGWLSA